VGVTESKKYLTIWERDSGIHARIKTNKETRCSV